MVQELCDPLRCNRTWVYSSDPSPLSEVVAILFLPGLSRPIIPYKLTFLYRNISLYFTCMYLPIFSCHCVFIIQVLHTSLPTRPPLFECFCPDSSPDRETIRTVGLAIDIDMHFSLAY